MLPAKAICSALLFPLCVCFFCLGVGGGGGGVLVVRFVLPVGVGTRGAVDAERERGYMGGGGGW
jgi:hypothetical protein